jgi:gamma-glutamyltranspeptidase/glutathione hydrolase
VDRNGNAVSITTTLNGGYGAKVVVREAGFCSTTKWTISA